MQVLGLWDSLSCAAVLQLVRAVTTAAPAGARAPPAAADAADAEDMVVDDDAGTAALAAPEAAAADAGGACAAQARLAAVLRGLARLLRVRPLSAQPDALRSIAETLAEAATLPQATGARPRRAPARRSTFEDKRGRLFQGVGSLPVHGLMATRLSGSPPTLRKLHKQGTLLLC
jgi:hypothetical protein